MAAMLKTGHRLTSNLPHKNALVSASSGTSSRQHLGGKSLHRFTASSPFSSSLFKCRASTDGTSKGPLRMPLPSNLPPRYQADAVTLMTDIENAQNWRDLVRTFAKLPRLPTNEMHLLGMAITLTMLAPGEEAQDMQEIAELQRFVAELVRATRGPVDGLYSVSQIATLLNCFINLGVPPPQDWLEGTEFPILAQIQQPEGVDRDVALAMLSIAWSYQVCGHVPRYEWAEALANCADVAWQGEAASSPNPPSQASTAFRASPESVILPSGEEVMIPQQLRDQQQMQQQIQQLPPPPMIEDLEGVQPLPAQCLSSLARAAMLWGMPTGQDWLERYLECVFFGLFQTRACFGGRADDVSPPDNSFADGGLGSPDPDLDLEEVGPAPNRLHFLFEEMSDVLWALVSCGVRPDQVWMRTFLEASGALLRRDASGSEPGRLGAEAVSTMLGALSSLSVVQGVPVDDQDIMGEQVQGGDSSSTRAPGSTPGPAWFEAALACCARCPAPTPPDLLGRVLFEVGSIQGVEMNSATMSSALELAHKAHVAMWLESEKEAESLAKKVEKQKREAAVQQRRHLRQKQGLPPELLGEEEDEGVAPTASAAAEDEAEEEEQVLGKNFSAQGLALLLVGAVQCGLLPGALGARVSSSSSDKATSDSRKEEVSTLLGLQGGPGLREAWLTTWSKRAVACAEHFTPSAVAGVMEAVLEADEKLPVSAVYSLGHRFLGATLTVLAREELRRKREKAGGSRLKSMEEGRGEGGDAADTMEDDGATPEQLINVLSALIHHNYALPGHWLQPLMTLTEAKLKQLDRTMAIIASELRNDRSNSALIIGDEDKRLSQFQMLESLNLMTQQLCLEALRVSGLIAAEAPAIWLSTLFERLEGEMKEDPQTVVQVGAALQEFGRLATTLMPKVEQSSMKFLLNATLDEEDQARLLFAFAATGHAPSSEWWEQLASGSLEASRKGKDKRVSETYLALQLQGYITIREVIGKEALEGNQTPGSSPAPTAGPWPLLWYRMVRDEALARLTVIGNTAVANSATLPNDRGGGGEEAVQMLEGAKVDSEQLPALRSEMAEALGALLPGLATTQECLAEECCDLIAGTTIWLMSDLSVLHITSCLRIFSHSNFTAPNEWLAEAAGVIIASTLTPQDICTLFTAYANNPDSAVVEPATAGTNIAADSSSSATAEQSSSLSETSASTMENPKQQQQQQQVRTLPVVIKKLLTETAAMADAFTPSQVLELLLAAAQLVTSGRIRATEMVAEARAVELLLRVLLQQATPTSLSSEEVATLMISIAQLELRPPEQWQQHFIALLMLDREAQQQQQGQGSSTTSAAAPGAMIVQRLHIKPQSVDNVITALEEWEARMEPSLLQALNAWLPELAATAPAVCSRTLYFLSNQRGWIPDLDNLSAAEPALTSALKQGIIPPSLHAPMLYALARAAAKQAAAQPSKSSSSSTPDTSRPQQTAAYRPSAQLLSAAVSATSSAMANYNTEYLVTVFTSLIALTSSAPLPSSSTATSSSSSSMTTDQDPSSSSSPHSAETSILSDCSSAMLMESSTWMERFFDFAIPSRCPPELLPGLVLALANAYEEAALVPGAAAGASRKPPQAWMQRLEGAVEESADRLGSRDAAVLLSSFSRLQVRPSANLVQTFLDSALRRVQAEQAAMSKRQQNKDQQQGAGGRTQAAAAAPGPEAAGLAGLLAAAYTNLRYTPPGAWNESARPLLGAVIAKIKDPSSRNAVTTALGATYSPSLETV
ncbi:hypothetical protein CEUSTIGMA_g4514.t1 [Chlamydomonas eustigma]|uniref:Uncharacterized protein n=1 Tax=Chlamydomonas eustigma TaxID=1157962 RepID=A0A250X1X0_9CHLO|nr:hypothetical protein CEUSTIGMA_g4514.t1 [Chlamydomonas eustigma]|eukprot:GAX77068.1 hypothetical protein CEUSTIGMA_g4514.t1 [Chlamydomonas eustigma]